MDHDSNSSTSCSQNKSSREKDYERLKLVVVSSLLMKHNNYNTDGVSLDDNDNNADNGTDRRKSVSDEVICSCSNDNTNPNPTNNDNLLLLQETAEMLSKQWPKGGSIQDYIKKMTSNQHGLPASYLLVKEYCADNNHDKTKEEEEDDDDLNNNHHNNHNSKDNNNKNDGSCKIQSKSQVLIGHGRLNECFESLAGNATAVTYIIINEKYRGYGHGYLLMKLLEKESINLGYHYMYLWTYTAINFYTKKLGYQITERVSLHRSCLKPLHTEQVNQLEDMLRSKQKKISTRDGSENNKSTKTKSKVGVISETILLPPTDDENAAPKDKDVWLRKRLVELDPNTTPTIISYDCRIQQIKDGIQAYLDRRNIYNTNNRNKNDSSLYQQQQQQQQKQQQPNETIISLVWKYHFIQLPWQQQVGPSCGLACLRMIRDYYYNTNNDSSNDNNDNNHYQSDETSSSSNPHQNNTNTSNDIMMPSLLNEAKIRGYTDDGEIFDANNLIGLATNVCGLQCNMRSFQSMKPMDVLKILGPISNSNNSISKSNSDIKKSNNYTKSMKNGLFILPYDTSKMTKLPCNNSGLTAHYGIIVGLLFAYNSNDIINHDNNNNNFSDETNANRNDTSCISLHELKYTNLNQLDSSFVDDAIEILLLVQHGLSSDLSIASWNEFLVSNQQLISYDKIKYNHVTNLNLQDCIIEFSSGGE